MATLTLTPAVPTERLVYSGTAALLLLAVLFGFLRTFYLAPLYPEMAQAVPPEAFFRFVHGPLVSLWFLLLLVQPLLVAAHRPLLHRQLGRVGAVLAVLILVTGVHAALLAAARPGGFMIVPVPPLAFLTVPLGSMLLFAACVGLALVWRHRPQHHKRLMLLSGIAMLGAATARWPMEWVTQPLFGGYYMNSDLAGDLFLLPLVLWDIYSRGRLHPVTLWGGLAVVLSHPLLAWLSGTGLWLAFAGWLVGA